jgi:metal-dependent HD superfamily phosphatase/phosphodiesterase
MMTVLTVAGTAIALLAVYAVATKPQPVEALAGETTIADATAAAETMATGRHLTPATRTDWQLTTVSALSDAEELLDVLEFQGFAERELVVLGNSCFAVRWR